MSAADPQSTRTGPTSRGMRPGALMAHMQYYDCASIEAMDHPAAGGRSRGRPRIAPRGLGWAVEPHSLPTAPASHTAEESQRWYVSSLLPRSWACHHLPAYSWTCTRHRALKALRTRQQRRVSVPSPPCWAQAAHQPGGRPGLAGQFLEDRRRGLRYTATSHIHVGGHRGIRMP
jgi:hypothetical protein